MIDALDHIALAAPGLEAAVADYASVLGRRPEGASFQLANMRLDLRLPRVAEETGLRLLGLAVADMGKATHLLRARALALAPAATGEPTTVMHIAPEGTHGVPIAIVADAGHAQAPVSAPIDATDEAGAVTGLDHVVIRSPNPERAVALYAGRLGLSLRLDRTEPAWGARLLFFRCGDLIVEIAHDLKAGISDAPDRLWGLTWRVPDIAKAHARLVAAGFDTSEVRKGRRPGTQVLTVRSRTASVPTLMIGPLSS
jgi:catechol 2,3-dioxygenase-like lactoylglutathione lyase family enzyme